MFSPRYRGKVLVGDAGMVAEAVIRKTCNVFEKMPIIIFMSNRPTRIMYSFTVWEYNLILNLILSDILVNRSRADLVEDWMTMKIGKNLTALVVLITIIERFAIM